MEINNLPQGYHKASTECDFYFWDGFGAEKPNEVKGRLLLIGVYDMYKEPKFGCVKLACDQNLDLQFSDICNCSSKSPQKLTIDGAEEINVGDRVLLFGQENKEENGIYTISNIGSEGESFELKRASDASAINAMQAGKFLSVLEGEKYKGHIFQLMPYDNKSALGAAKFAFLDLSKEGFYSNGINGFRLVHSICCSQMSANKSTFSFACPDFLNTDTPRMVKVLVPYNVELESVFASLLKKEFDFSDSVYNPSCCTSYL